MRPKARVVSPVPLVSAAQPRKMFRNCSAAHCTTSKNPKTDCQTHAKKNMKGSGGDYATHAGVIFFFVTHEALSHNEGTDWDFEDKNIAS